MQSQMGTRRGRPSQVNLNDVRMQEALAYVVSKREESVPMTQIESYVFEQYGLTRYQVYAMLHDTGNFRRMQGVNERRKIELRTLDRNNEIVDAYDKGKSISQISRELGLTRQRVHQIVRRDRPNLIRTKKEVLDSPSEHPLS